MFRSIKLAALTLCLWKLGTGFALAQTPQASNEPPRVVVSIYHVAPGKHLDFLKWMASGEAVDKEAGLAPAQWYVHENGDSWDFISITPVRTDAEDKKTEELSKAKGLKTGFAAALEFRQFISSHTDTFAFGPQTAADLVSAAGAK
jgi:hypothetical protein